MNLLVTGAWPNGASCIDILQALGHKVVYMQCEKDDLPCEKDWVEGVVCNALFLHHPIERFRNLRYIQLTSAGFDRIPMGYVKEHNIEVHNAKGVYSVPMAEFAMAGVLQIYKEMDFFRINQRVGRWEKHRGLRELAGKTVCIVGCGSVGTECAKRFRGFACRVVGVDVSHAQNENFQMIVSIDELDRVLPEADVIVLTLPLTDQTWHLLNARRFSRMKAGAVLVNISRGAVVDTEALIAALEKTLGGAVLDVFEEEPLCDDSPLWDMQNIILAPHNSFVGEGNLGRLRNVIIENMEHAGDAVL